MNHATSDRILIAGAGIAGLTAALAFASRGHSVAIFERTGRLEEVGAGLQLSPNATRILDRLGVLGDVVPYAVRPQAVVLRRAADLREIGRVPMGDFAEQRWGAPYLVVHRADLQRALISAVARHSNIVLTTDAVVRDFALDGIPQLTVEHDGQTHEEQGTLLIGADGVWSALRAHAGAVGRSRFIGQMAWRRMFDADDPTIRPLLQATGGDVVTAFLHPGFHLIAYPVRAGAAINLVAFTRMTRDLPADWSVDADVAPLARALRDTAPELARLTADTAGWTAWPIHVADLDGAWIEPRGLALIGDAAHAMTPFAAQGAAMAIEDAETLAATVTGAVDRAAALVEWGIARRRRVLRVARRGALNQFAWHARGPVALARDAFLKWRGPHRLAADLDWLYGAA